MAACMYTWLKSRIMVTFTTLSYGGDFELWWGWRAFTAICKYTFIPYVRDRGKTEDYVIKYPPQNRNMLCSSLSFVTIVDWLPTSAHFKDLVYQSAHLKLLNSQIDRQKFAHTQPRKTPQIIN